MLNVARAEPLDEGRILMGEELTRCGIECGELGVVFGIKRESEDVKVFAHTFRANSLGSNDGAQFEDVAQNNLTHRASVLFRNFGNHGVCEETIAAFCKGRPSFGLHAILFHHFARGFLLTEGINFDLVHHWADSLMVTEVNEAIRREV